MIHRPEIYIAVSSLLLSAGSFGLLTRKNFIGTVISLEILLNGVGLLWVTLDRFRGGNGEGMLFALLIMALAAAEVSVALSLAFLLRETRNSINIDEAEELKH